MTVLLFGQRTVERPPLQSVVKRCVTDPKMARPFSDGHGVTVEREMATDSPVAVLLGACRPPAIGFRVGTVVVSAVKAHPVRATSHVGQEGGIGIPSGIDCDAAPSVIGVLRPHRIVATTAHVAPRRVFAGLVGLAVHRERIAGACSDEASATQRLTSAQVLPAYQPGHTARADTSPMRTAVDADKRVSDGPRAEALTSKILDSHSTHFNAIAEAA